MSLIVPRETIDALRDFVDTTLDAAGVDCTLYIPTSASYKAAEAKDVFATPSDYSYTKYTAKTFIVWNPNTIHLKRLGLFVEDELPVLCWFGKKAIVAEGADAGSEVEVDIVLHSYFEVEPEFIPSNYTGIEQFEIVNVAAGKLHDAIIRKRFLAIPRRVKVE